MHATVEYCDDGNTEDFDACSNLCSCGTANGWQLDAGGAATSWGHYLSAGASSNYMTVLFAQPVFGTDGNQTMPYPTSELENSKVRSPPMVIAPSLEFESWHVDEGSCVDNKVFSISLEMGIMFNVIMDCTQNQGVYPMCSFLNMQRPPEPWDAISIPVPAQYVGQMGIIRIAYDTQDTCCSFEQGWYMRNANFLGTCP